MLAIPEGDHRWYLLMVATTSPIAETGYTTIGAVSRAYAESGKALELALTHPAYEAEYSEAYLQPVEMYAQTQAPIDRLLRTLRHYGMQHPARWERHLRGTQPDYSQEPQTFLTGYYAEAYDHKGREERRAVPIACSKGLGLGQAIEDARFRNWETRVMPGHALGMGLWVRTIQVYDVL